MKPGLLARLKQTSMSDRTKTIVLGGLQGGIIALLPEGSTVILIKRLEAKRYLNRRQEAWMVLTSEAVVGWVWGVECQFLTEEEKW